MYLTFFTTSNVRFSVMAVLRLSIWGAQKLTCSTNGKSTVLRRHDIGTGRFVLSFSCKDAASHLERDDA